ncbi:hypothetical protein K466DRAFT_505613 [Polyporus arcularius HHB13444]|uniref:HAT C-terminal dimerisation domain-containing protein n=1 Tax=Polyporus arcularius HHB13444 TaxID=1314778 RepID=A0A5C3NP36_9APHY|nr:hypothetical protein K466DRAFT_505613 [Polyporus arcularius HHB13444]
MEAQDGPQAGANSDQLEDYLSAPTEPCSDPVKYWAARKGSIPGLARMGLDYSTIPATAVDVERTFSKGRLVLSHVRSRLSAQTTRALLCVGEWSRLDLLRLDDVKPAVDLPDLEGEEEFEMAEGWERVHKALVCKK